MDSTLSHLPVREKKPRKSGLTMVMDKGLSLRQADDFISVSSEYTDLVKLGFGTALVTPNVKEKIRLYRDAGLRVYLGGTLFEAFWVRNAVNDYEKFMLELGIDTVEISDGSIGVSHDEKCKMIERFAKKYTVLSEVGSKEAGILIHPKRWISMMKSELNAGSFKVIAEARESGNVGIYRPNGTAHVALVDKILNQVPKKDILWESPQKSQQVWFIKLLGANVNLGNIAPDEVISLETLRIGVRGDTFFSFLPEELKNYKQQTS